MPLTARLCPIHLLTAYCGHVIAHSRSQLLRSVRYRSAHGSTPARVIARARCVRSRDPLPRLRTTNSAPGSAASNAARSTGSIVGVTGTPRCSWPSCRSVLGDRTFIRPRCPSTSAHRNPCDSLGTRSPAYRARANVIRASGTASSSRMRADSAGVTYRAFFVGVDPPCRWSNRLRGTSSRVTAVPYISRATVTWVRTVATASGPPAITACHFDASSRVTVRMSRSDPKWLTSDRQGSAI